MATELTVITGRIDPAIVEREVERDPRLKSHNTKRGYRRDLAAFEDWRQGRPMTKLLVEEYAAHLLAGDPANDVKPKTPGTVNRSLASIRWWARRLGDLAYEVPIDEAQRAEVVTQAGRVASIENVDEPGGGDPTGRHIEVGELQALMAACDADQTPAGVRDAAVIALAWNTGLRRFELAGLALADVEWTAADEATLTIRGKRGKTRPAYVFNGAAEALHDWLAIRGDQPGALFLAIDSGGNVARGQRRYGRRGHEGESYAGEPGLTTEALAQLLEKRRGQAGVKPLTWHDFRRTFAGNLLDRADMVTVQKLMGHSSPITTSRYDRRPERARRQAAASLHVPYRRRLLHTG